MNIEAVESVIRREMCDAEIDFAQNCRDAVQFLYKAIENLGDDSVRLNYLVYIDPDTGNPRHYALQVTDRSGEMLLINPIKAAMFPKFIGLKDQAPQLFELMEVIDRVW